MNLVITGTSTSTGIGQSLVRHLGARGHRIWGLARTPHEECDQACAASGIDFRYSVADISDWERMRAFAAEVEQAWDRVDGLVCCAGIQGPICDAMKADPAGWAQNISINLVGTYHTLRALHPLLRRATRRGKVVCFSGGGSTGPRLNFTPYACAKAGVLRLVEILAHEWSDQALDINAIAPGAVNTRMTEEVLQLGPDVVGPKEFATATRQWEQGGTPPEAFVPLVEFLLGEPSDGISGRLLSALWDPWKDLPRHVEALQKSDIYTLRRIIPKDRGLDWEERRS